MNHLATYRETLGQLTGAQLSDELARVSLARNSDRRTRRILDLKREIRERLQILDDLQRGEEREAAS